MQIKDMQRLISQSLRQAATEYEKGHPLITERLIDSAINGINKVKEEIEAASGACEVE